MAALFLIINCVLFISALRWSVFVLVCFCVVQLVTYVLLSLVSMYSLFVRLVNLFASIFFPFIVMVHCKLFTLVVVLVD